MEVDEGRYDPVKIISESFPTASVLDYVVRNGDTLQSIAAQSQFDKRVRVPLFSPLRMLAGLAVGRIYSRKKVIEFYRKRVPLAGGISNVNLNRSWPVEFHPDPLLDYIRVSPTGPMMPLVLSLSSKCFVAY